LVKYRDFFKQKRNKLSLSQILDFSQKIEDFFWNLEAVQKAPQIFMYLSFKQEPHTLKIIEKALKLKKEVLVPVVKQGEMQSAFLKNTKQLKKGAFGILEPCETLLKNPDQQCVFVIPGLVFDRQGNRMGYGKGFYDRFLEKKPQLKIAFAYSFQVLGQILSQPHDVLMDKIITEKEIILC